MRTHWRFPQDVCGNSDDVGSHVAVVAFTLFYAAHFPAKRVTLGLFALLEIVHTYAHYTAAPESWALIHYTAIACAYSIKPVPLRTLVPFLYVDVIGHLLGNDMLSIGTTMAFAATRFEGHAMRYALALTFALFAVMELVVCQYVRDLHEGWDMGLALAMMAGVRWFCLST